jgi:hypothetical protein
VNTFHNVIVVKILSLVVLVMLVFTAISLIYRGRNLNCVKVNNQ